MAVYNKSGAEISAVNKINGDYLSNVYDIDGNLIGMNINPVTPLSWNMSDEYKDQVLSTLDYIGEYEQNHPSAYAFCQFNDVHRQWGGNEPNFIDYNGGYNVLSYMAFLGDLVDQGKSAQYTSSVNFMAGAQMTPRLVVMGNHEYYNYNPTVEGNPEAIYKTQLNATPCVFKTNDALIYYHDDETHGVRYIALDYFYITQDFHDTGHLLDLDQLNWLATTMENAGSRDIIIMAHSMLNPFYRLLAGTKTSSSARLQNQDKLEDLIDAFKSRGTYTVTIDDTTYSHDFSLCNGSFVMYTSGHYHIAGYTSELGDTGWNMFTCMAKKGTSSGTQKGFTFYLVDKTEKTIETILCAEDFTEPISYSFEY